MTPGGASAEGAVPICGPAPDAAAVSCGCLLLPPHPPPTAAAAATCPTSAAPAAAAPTPGPQVQPDARRAAALRSGHAQKQQPGSQGGVHRRCWEAGRTACTRALAWACQAHLLQQRQPGQAGVPGAPPSPPPCTASLAPPHLTTSCIPACPPYPNLCAGGSTPAIAAQLAALGGEHIGYSSKRFPGLGLTLLGARPFSKGGKQWSDVAGGWAWCLGLCHAPAARVLGPPRR